MARVSQYQEAGIPVRRLARAFPFNLPPARVGDLIIDFLCPARHERVSQPGANLEHATVPFRRVVVCAGAAELRMLPRCCQDSARWQTRLDGLQIAHGLVDRELCLQLADDWSGS
jgi:hypothetical protein